MKILREIDSEDCFDGNFIKEYELDEPLSMDFVEHIGRYGQINVLADLPRPFFTFDRRYFFAVKGIVGETSIKVIYRRNHMDITEGVFGEIISAFGKNDAVAGMLSKKMEDISSSIDRLTGHGK